MTLNEILSSLPKNNWLPHLIVLRDKGETMTLQDEEIDEVIDRTLDILDNDRIGKCLDWISLALLSKHQLALNEFKKNGILRTFTYIKRQNHASTIIKFLLDNQHTFNFSSHDLSYLTSIQNYQSFHKIIQTKRLRIIKEITKQKKIIVKTLYSYVDSAFQLPPEKFPDTGTLDEFSNEEVAEGAAYIIEEFNSMFGISDQYIALSNPDYITSGSIEKLLIDACHIKFLQETEIWIERLGHACTKVNDEFFIAPPSAEFGKSYRLGNILLELNREGQHLVIGKRSTSLYEFIKQFNEQTENSVLYWDDNSQRYMLAIPGSAYLEMYNEKHLLNEGFFREEMLYFQEVEDLLHISADKLKHVELIPGFTFYDLRIAKRVLTFISLAYFDLLEKKSLTDYYNSNIPFLKTETLQVILCPAIGEKKTEIFLENFSYPNDQDFFDIQYTPLLKGTDHYIVPYNVFTESNIFRNILFPLNTRLFDSKNDPISDKLEEVLLEKGFRVQKGLKFKFNKKESDIDIVGIMGNNIFIFESKNSVLPVNAFEFRSVFEQLEKAAEKQLPLSLMACRDKAFRNTYNIKVEDENKEVNIYSCIVTTNRLLSGYVMNGFPVRNIKELYDFIQVGEKGFTGIEEDGNAVYSLWEGESFTTDDLISYLRPDTKFYKYMFDSQFEYKQKYEIEPGTNLYFSIYPYNQDDLVENFKNLKLKKTRNIQPKDVSTST